MFLADLRTDLRAGRFVPLAVRERLIPKSGGRLRWLGIPAGTIDGSLTPVVYTADGRQFLPFILWTYGTIEIQFAALSRRPPFDRLDLRRELRERLEALPSVSIPDEKLDKRPGIPMITLSDPAGRQQFIATME